MDKSLQQVTNEALEKFSKYIETPAVKEFIENTKAAADTGEFEIVITTEDVDRMGEVIKLDGWELDKYLMNPVVLWGHNSYDLPIGITTSLEKRDGKIIAKGKFASEEANPFAQQVRQLYDLGIQRASSVGFIEKERTGNVIVKAELIEWSFVSVPANPMALSTLVKSNISVNEMVTKGLISVKEEAPADATVTEKPEAPKEDPVPPEPVAPVDAEQKFVATKQVTDLVSSLKAMIVALEDLVSKNQEPEGTDELSADEVKDFKKFSESRKILQEASTIIGEVLAEARQAIDARKK